MLLAVYAGLRGFGRRAKPKPASHITTTERRGTGSERSDGASRIGDLRHRQRVKQLLPSRYRRLAPAVQRRAQAPTTCTAVQRRLAPPAASAATVPAVTQASGAGRRRAETPPATAAPPSPRPGQLPNRRRDHISAPIHLLRQLNVPKRLSQHQRPARLPNLPKRHLKALTAMPTRAPYRLMHVQEDGL